MDRWGDWPSLDYLPFHEEYDNEHILQANGELENYHLSPNSHLSICTV